MGTDVITRTTVRVTLNYIYLKKVQEILILEKVFILCKIIIDRTFLFNNLRVMFYRSVKTLFVSASSSSSEPLA